MNSLINQFSSHLFWDVNPDEIDFEKNKSFLIQRVLEYGTFTDWILIKKHYGINEIAKTATQFKILEKKALSFISALSSIPKESFKCYTYQQSIPPHWNF